MQSLSVLVTVSFATESLHIGMHSPKVKFSPQHLRNSRLNTTDVISQQAALARFRAYLPSGGAAVFTLH